MEKKSRKDRFWEILPGALVWTALLLPWVLAPTAPLALAYFIIIYDFWWFVRVSSMTRHLFRAHWWTKFNLEKNWETECKKTENFGSFLKGLKDEKEKLVTKNKFLKLPQDLKLLAATIKRGEYRKYKLLDLEINNAEKIVEKNEVLDWREIYHVAMIATYQEGLEILRPSVKSIVDCHYDSNKIILVLACEERDKENAQKLSKQLEKEFGKYFKKFLITMHPDNIPGEVKGKGANITWAGRELKKWIDKEGLDYEKIVLTTLDADHRAHPYYFHRLSYSFVTTANRHHKSYQPLPFFDNNVWDATAISRFFSLTCSFWHMIESTRPYRLKNFSSHAQSFKALIDTDFWSVTSIVEDGHQFWRTFLTYKGDHEAVPLFVPIYQDAILAPKFTETLGNLYKQHRRWAWGATDIGFVAKYILPDKEIPRGKKFYFMARLMEGSLTWATTPFLITFTGWLPFIFSESFRFSAISQSMFNILTVLWLLAILGLCVNLYIGLSILPPKPSHKKGWIMYFMWIWSPITFFMSALPPLDAQTRLMFGRYLEFWVTPKVSVDKVRKPENLTTTTSK